MTITFRVVSEIPAIPAIDDGGAGPTQSLAAQLGEHVTRSTPSKTPWPDGPRLDHQPSPSPSSSRRGSTLPGRHMTWRPHHQHSNFFFTFIVTQTNQHARAILDTTVSILRYSIYNFTVCIAQLAAHHITRSATNGRIENFGWPSKCRCNKSQVQRFCRIGSGQLSNGDGDDVL